MDAAATEPFRACWNGERRARPGQEAAPTGEGAPGRRRRQAESGAVETAPPGR